MNPLRLLFASAFVLTVAMVAIGADLRQQTQGGKNTNTTVILVHGAFADASSWSGVVQKLHAAGVKVLAVPNPLRGLTSDGEYVASIAKQTDGPVLLVGHSYGGPVITYAGSKASNVKGLVFVASFGIDRGQSINDSTAAFPAPLLATSIEPRQYPNGGTPGVELYIQNAKFAQVFAADVPAAQQTILAVSQRPVAAAAFGEPLSITPAWKTLPSWFLVTTQDNAINTESQRAAAKRMNATVLEVAASHAVAVSQPQTVTDFILKALSTLP